MKIIKTASGKKQIKISKKEWESIGQKAGWIKEAQGSREEVNTSDPDWITAQLKNFIVSPDEFWQNITFTTGDSFLKASDREKLLKSMLIQLKNTSPNLDMFSKLEQKAIAKQILSLKKDIEVDKVNEKQIEELSYQDAPIEEDFLSPGTAPIALEDAPADTKDVKINTDMPTLRKDLGEINESFATEQDIEDDRNQLFDEYNAGDINLDQLKSMLKLIEFAKKNLEKIVLSFKRKELKK